MKVIKGIKKMEKYFYMAIICSIMLFSGCQGAKEKKYAVKDGKGNAEIIIAEKPTRMQAFAAQEMQHYLKKLTGAEVPVLKNTANAEIKIYIGKSKYTDKMGIDNKDLDYGAYRMVSGDNYLVIIGNDKNYFMDKPGDGGPEFPRNRGERKKAAEAWRKKNGNMWSSPYMSYFKGYHKELDLWLADKHGSLNGVNDFLRSLGVRWYMPGDFGEYLPKITSIAIPQNVNKTVKPDWDERYIMFYFNAPFMASPDEFKWQLRLGFSLDTKVYSGHGSDRLVKYNDYVKKNHPEFYALYGGKRAHEKPCYSSKGLFNSALGFASLMYDKYDKDVVSFMPVDGYTSHCHCKLCVGKDTPERGFAGSMSDHVWKFMNDLAKETSKKYPDKKILNYAYNCYRVPPLKIDKFHPNLQVGVCHHRNEFNNPDRKKYYQNLTDEFIKKSATKRIRLWEYYQSGDSIPKYYPRLISEDIKHLKGHVYSEMIESRRANPKHLKKGQPDPCLATNHVNVWVTTRLWWDPDKDVNKMLEEYYKNFYGPVAKEMKAFIEHCEKTWFKMRSEYEPIQKAFDLLAKASKTAGENNIYARRVQMVIDYIQPMKGVMKKLKIGRSMNPVAVLKTAAKPELKLDGKLDEKVWQGLKKYSLQPMNDKSIITQKTTFRVFFSGDSIYYGIRCEEDNIKGMKVLGVKNDDMQIFNGDSVEVLLETPNVSYYQLAFDPKGNMTDVKRSGAALGKKGKIETKWESSVKCAAFKGDKFWSVEIKIPALGANQDDLLPFYGVSGDKPTKKFPWYFNVCRIRHAGSKVETATFSPTETSGFHNIMKFGKLAP
ncbi:MAG: DUF4838 domain-containing protein [Planctomycetota bacterium]|jgi:hypothetical protein